MNTKKEYLNQEVNLFLSQLGINNHPGLLISMNQHGYKHFTFGAKPHIRENNRPLYDLAHELAHAIEFGAKSFKDLATEFGFSFHLRSIFK